MRLIDADEFKKGLAVTDDTDAYRNETFKKISEIICDWIDREPTVDAKPVVRAKWTYYKNNGITDYFKCSSCDNVVKVSLDDFPKHKFCSNCGARMDGD